MHDAVAQAEEGFPIEVVAPCEGTGYEIGSMSLVEGAQNPDEAKVFYDWVLGADVQSHDARGRVLPDPVERQRDPARGGAGPR